MNSELNDKIARLPKWVQDLVTHQRQTIDDLEKQRDEAYAAINGGKESRVYISGHRRQPDIPLPEDAEVTFSLDIPDGRRHEVNVRLVYHHRTGKPYRVSVRTDWGAMQIHPNCANSIEISEEE
jgi:hypothetical protein